MFSNQLENECKLYLLPVINDHMFQREILKVIYKTLHINNDEF